MNTDKRNKVLKVENRIDDLAAVEIFLEELSDEWAISPSLVLSINLVLEEAFTNIVKYGYDDAQKHSIEFYFSLGSGLLTIRISDDGHEWDPTLKADPDITLSAEERPIGGLGILMIKKIMDSVHYERIENKNILTLTKKVEI